MTISVTIELAYNFTVHASAQEAFDLLSDIPTCASFFPNLDQLVDLGEATYRWEMEKISVAQVELQTLYACKYVADKVQQTIVWTPVEGEGNALVSGEWAVGKKNQATHIALQLTATLELPLPGFMSGMVTPVVEKKFTKLIEKYLVNLTARLGGEV